uniref:Putative plant transposon protein domain-containing protein n=1 Tax=Solanum tuberosum TaxID=4113 RepID=M1DK00_SOLTU
MFFSSIVRTGLFPPQVDNIMACDRIVMLPAIMSGLELNFSRILIAEIHETAFKTTTMLPFLFPIFHLCRDASLPIWHCYRLTEETKSMDIGLIKDDVNPAGPLKRPHIYLPHLADDLAADVEKIHVEYANDTTMPAPTEHSRAAPSTSTSETSSSSRDSLRARFSTSGPSPEVRDPDGHPITTHEAQDALIY